MKKGVKIALIVTGVLTLGGLIWWGISASSNKSGVKAKDDRRITFTKTN